MLFISKVEVNSQYLSKLIKLMDFLTKRKRFHSIQCILCAIQLLLPSIAGLIPLNQDDLRETFGQGSLSLPMRNHIFCCCKKSFFQITQRLTMVEAVIVYAMEDQKPVTMNLKLKNTTQCVGMCSTVWFHSSFSNGLF